MKKKMNKEKKIVSIFCKSSLQYSKIGQCLERNYLSLKGKRSAKQDFHIKKKKRKKNCEARHLVYVPRVAEIILVRVLSP